VSEAENVRVVEQVFEAFGRADVPAFLALLTDDVEWTIAGPEVVPYAGERRGHDGVTQFLQAIGGAVEMERFEPQEFIAQGEQVAVVGFERGCLRASGRTFDNPWVLVFTLRGGKVARFRSFEDTHAVAQAFAG
jgi:ketosteroid isomerase-like protein